MLGGYICVIVKDNCTCKSNDVWLMKDYGVESSWTQIYKIEQDVMPWTVEDFKPLMFSNNGKKVLLMEGQYAHKKFFWYDIEKKNCKVVKNRSFPKSFRLKTCIGSLLLLHGDNVIDPRQKKNKRKREVKTMAFHDFFFFFFGGGGGALIGCLDISLHNHLEAVVVNDGKVL